MQDIGMQEDGCYKTPVLPGQYGLIVSCSVGDEYIPVLRIAEDIGQDVMPRSRACREGNLVGCNAPQRNCDNCNDPGNPTCASQAAQCSMPVHSGIITQPDCVVSASRDHMRCLTDLSCRILYIGEFF